MARALSLSALFVVAPLAAQQTWVVDRSGGPGVHFTDLPPAVAAAAPGDTIRLVPQPCSPYPGDYTAPVISKGVRIVAGSLSVNLSGPLVFRNVPVHERVVIQGLRLSPYGNTLISGVQVENCQGPVQLERVELRDQYSWVPTMLRLVDCPDVTLSDCRFMLEANSAEITRCTAQIVRSGFSCGGKQLHPLDTRRSPRLPAITITNSDVTLLATQVFGQNGTAASGPSCMFPPVSTVTAMAANGSTIRVGPGSWIDGGYYSDYGNACGGQVSYCQLASIAGSGNVVYLHPGVHVNCPPPFAAEVMRPVATGPVRFGVQADANVQSGSGTLVGLVAGFTMHPPLPTVFGNWSLDLASMLTVGIGLADETGVAHFRFTVDLPRGTLIGLQAGILLPNGRVVTSLPTRVAVD